VDLKFLKKAENIWIQEREGNMRLLYCEEVHSLYSSLNIIGGIKVREDNKRSTLIMVINATLIAGKPSGERAQRQM
jgi:hypothetical protein